MKTSRRRQRWKQSPGRGDACAPNRRRTWQGASAPRAVESGEGAEVNGIGCCLRKHAARRHEESAARALAGCPCFVI